MLFCVPRQFYFYTLCLLLVCGFSRHALAVETILPSADEETAAQEDLKEGEFLQKEDEGDARKQGEGPSKPYSYGVMAIPALNYNEDNGFGIGVVGKAYRFHEDYRPYQIAMKVQVFMTTKLLQDHEFEIDVLDLFSLPLRLTGRLGFYSSVSQNFCGYGNAVTCDEEEASNAALLQGYTDPGSKTQFERRYYLTRFIRPYGVFNLRWKLRDLPHRVELMGGWRGYYYMSGELFDRDGDQKPDLYPYPGSLYQQYHKVGEDGLASVFQFGVMLDNRDSEPAPKEGYWLEASIRAASFLWGSAWNYVGYNLTTRNYLSLLRSKTLILANRFVADGIYGDAPLQEMIRVGGSRDYIAFGGEAMGRGIRVQRYPGRIKFMNQAELRHDLFAWRGLLDEADYIYTAVAFLDLGYLAYDWTNFGGDPFQVNTGFGVGGRLMVGQEFIIRADLAGSPEEPGELSVYINVGNTF